MIKLIPVLIALSLISGTAWFSYEAGFDSCSSKNAEAIAKEITKDAKKVEMIIEYREKIKVVYRDRIKIIKKVKDPSGCLNMDLRNVGLGSMLPRSDQN